MVLESEEAQAISQAQQLLVIIYYSGPQFLVDHLLQSPVRVWLETALSEIVLTFSHVVGYLLDRTFVVAF